MKFILNRFHTVLQVIIVTMNIDRAYSMSSMHHHHGNKSCTYCNRPWKKVELLVPIGLKNGSSRNSEWSDVFLHSMSMFWPIKQSNTSVVLILDDEIKGSELQHRFVDEVIKDGRNRTNFPRISVKHHTAKIEYKSGHDRQQHLMFYADHYTEVEYVGFGDSDCLFYTHIDREDLFENNKPIVHDRIGYVKKKETPKSRWPATTYNVLGMEQPMICMSYFPVIVKTVHLRELRDFVETKHKTTFDSVFLTYLSGNAFSQFNIMCTFMWYQRKDDYTWYIHDTSPWWDGNNPAPMWGQWSERWIFDNKMLQPKPFISTHVRYRFTASPLVNNPDNLNRLFLRGLCHTTPEKNVLNLNCTQYLHQVNHVFDEQLRFEDADYTDQVNLTEAKSTQLQRMHRFKHCDLSYGDPALLQHFGKYNYAKADYEHILVGSN